MREVSHKGLSLVVSASLVLGLVPTPSLASTGNDDASGQVAEEVVPQDAGEPSTLSDIVDGAADAKDKSEEAQGGWEDAVTPVELRLGEDLLLDVVAGSPWVGRFVAPEAGDYELRLADATGDSVVLELSADEDFLADATKTADAKTALVESMQKDEVRYCRVSTAGEGAQVSVRVRAVTEQLVADDDVITDAAPAPAAPASEVEAPEAVLGAAAPDAGEKPEETPGTAATGTAAPDAAPGATTPDAGEKPEAVTGATAPGATPGAAAAGEKPEAATVPTAADGESAASLKAASDVIDLSKCTIKTYGTVGYVAGSSPENMYLYVSDTNDQVPPYYYDNTMRVYYNSQGSELGQAPSAPGTYYVAIRANEGSASYTGETPKIPFRVFAANDIGGPGFYVSWRTSDNRPYRVYTGKPVEGFDASVYYLDDTSTKVDLTWGTDYAFDHFETADGQRLNAAPVELGSYYVVYAGKGSYTGYCRLEFEIYDPMDLGNYYPSLGGSSLYQDGMYEYGYQGKPVCPGVGLVNRKGGTIGPLEGKDYTVTYSNNNVIHQNGEYATATVSPKAGSGYHGMASVNFRIVDTKDLRVYRYTYGVTLSTSAGESQTNTDGFCEFKYTGSPIKPTVSFATKAGVETPIEGRDYEVTYEDDDSTTGHVHSLTVNAKEGSQFVGSVVINYKVSTAYTLSYTTTTITPDSDSQSKLTNVSNRNSYAVIDDTLDLFGVAWNVLFNGNKLVENRDYKLSKKEMEDRADIEEGVEYVFSGMGNYTHSVSRFVYRTKNPNAIDISGATVAPIKGRGYDGKPYTPEPKVTLDGKTLVKGTDYTLSYKNNVSAGKATLTITGRRNYKGTKTVYFDVWRNGQPMDAWAVARQAPAASLRSRDVTVEAPIHVAHAVSAAKPMEFRKVGGDSRLSVDVATGRVTVRKGTPAGTYKVTIRAIAFGGANYADGSRTVECQVRVVGGKLDQDLQVTAADVTRTAASLASADYQTRPFKVAMAAGNVTYKPAGGSGCLSVDSAGRLKIARGTKAGTYYAKVYATAAGDAGYKSCTRIVTAKVVVK